jgi:hypothetical protein
MVKHNDEIELLGQLVASLIRELVETNRQVLELENRSWNWRKNKNQPANPHDTKINIVLFPFFLFFFSVLLDPILNANANHGGAITYRLRPS